MLPPAEKQSWICSVSEWGAALKRCAEFPKVKESRAVIVPIGSTEQHGYHMALLVDTVVRRYVSRALAERTGCVVMPAVWLRMVHGRLSCYGFAALGDLCRSCEGYRSQFAAPGT